MSYDEKLAQRVRDALTDQTDLVEKKMFGGVGYMLRGNMACGILEDNLIVRVGPERYETALEEQHTRLFDTRGRPMKGWIMVLPGGTRSDADLKSWIQQGIEFTLSLPPK